MNIFAHLLLGRNANVFSWSKLATKCHKNFIQNSIFHVIFRFFSLGHVIFEKKKNEFSTQCVIRSGLSKLEKEIGKLDRILRNQQWAIHSIWFGNHHKHINKRNTTHALKHAQDVLGKRMICIFCKLQSQLKRTVEKECERMYWRHFAADDMEKEMESSISTTLQTTQVVWQFIVYSVATFIFIILYFSKSTIANCRFWISVPKHFESFLCVRCAMCNEHIHCWCWLWFESYPANAACASVYHLSQNLLNHQYRYSINQLNVFSCKRFIFQNRRCNATLELLPSFSIEVDNAFELTAFGLHFNETNHVDSHYT